MDNGHVVEERRGVVARVRGVAEGGEEEAARLAGRRHQGAQQHVRVPAVLPHQPAQYMGNLPSNSFRG